MKNKLLFLSGSPKGTKGTSYAFLEYLNTKLAEHNLTGKIVMLHRLLRESEELDEVLASIDEMEYIIISAPLYVDTLPAHVLEAISQIANYRKAGTYKRSPKFIGIVNSGFPEAHQNDLALNILKRFAVEVGFEWMGGIPFGGGAMIGGTPLDKAGGRGRFARLVIESLAKSLIDGTGVSEETIEIANKKVIPTWLYVRMSKMGWKKWAKSYGMEKNLDAQPYKTKILID